MDHIGDDKLIKEACTGNTSTALGTDSFSLVRVAQYI